MPRPRPYLSCVAAAWVVCQLAAFAAAPIVLSVEALSNTTAAEVCTCSSATPGAACPMHHGHGNSDQSRQDCKLRNSCASPDLALLSLAGGIGDVPAQSAAASDHIATVVSITLVTAPSRVEFPESPPPRS
jgi:hypothetical protein